MYETFNKNTFSMTCLTLKQFFVKIYSLSPTLGAIFNYFEKFIKAPRWAPFLTILNSTKG